MELWPGQTVLPSLDWSSHDTQDRIIVLFGPPLTLWTSYISRHLSRPKDNGPPKWDTIYFISKQNKSEIKAHTYSMRMESKRL